MRKLGLTELFMLLIVVSVAAIGCVTPDSTPQIEQAMELARLHTGEEPGWNRDWDESPPAWADDKVLTLGEAVELSLRNNRELRAEIETIGQAQADLIQAGLLQNPVLTLGAKLPSGGGRALFEGGLIPFQGLRDLWLIPLRKETADAALQEAILRVSDLAVAQAAQTKALYARVQHSQRTIQLTNENLSIIEQMVTLIQSRHAAGRAAQIEVNTERIRRLRLQSDLLAQQADYRRLKRELLLAMGMAEASDSWSVTPFDESDTGRPQITGEDELVHAAQSDRLDLCALRWNVWMAQRQLTLARKEAWPAFDLSFAFEREAAPPSQNPSFAAQAGNAAAGALVGQPPGAPAFEPFGPKPREVKWLVGPMLDLEIPVFDQNQAQILKAAHELRRRYSQYSALQQRIHQKVRELNVMHHQASEQVKLFRDAIIPDVRANLELIQNSYRAGADVFTDYLRAQEDLIGTRLTALAFLRDAVIYHAELEREVGGRLPDPGTRAAQSAADESQSIPDEEKP